MHDFMTRRRRGERHMRRHRAIVEHAQMPINIAQNLSTFRHHPPGLFHATPTPHPPSRAWNGPPSSCGAIGDTTVDMETDPHGADGGRRPAVAIPDHHRRQQQPPHAPALAPGRPRGAPGRRVSRPQRLVARANRSRNRPKMVEKVAPTGFKL